MMKRQRCENGSGNGDGGGDGNGSGDGGGDRVEEPSGKRQAVLERLLGAVDAGKRVPTQAVAVFATIPRWPALDLPPVRGPQRLADVLLPPSEILAWTTRHAVPYRPLERSVPEVANAPCPPSVPFPSRFPEEVARGVKAENDFRAAMERNGWATRHPKNRSYYDRAWHVDWMVRKDGRELWADVKGVRKIKRLDGWQNAVIVMELHARGFLQGRADVMAFQVHNDEYTPRTDADDPRQIYLLMDRVKLKDWLAARLDFALPPVLDTREAHYRAYQRDDDARSVITFVDAEEAYRAAGCGKVVVD